MKSKEPLKGTFLYTIRLGDKYLQGIEANENYSPYACAPTMGNRYTPNDYKTIWGDSPKLIEKLTVSSYLQVLFNEFVWKEQKLNNIIIEPVLTQ